ncbi:hypothetical protein Y1Q_0010677 [Alligator mississippiensis]|uniref:Uncharacterized protein n=1 Tax=Alligator mississippiensis TaxID=8496 RepID=A0A151M6G5_ALLMI|nr:hypothetical protein Y1Q_0010677 [Alligator mississippiensis]
MGTKAGWLANQAVVSLQLGKAQKGEQKVVSCRKEEFMIRRIDDQPLQEAQRKVHQQNLKFSFDTYKTPFRCSTCAAVSCVTIKIPLRFTSEIRSFFDIAGYSSLQRGGPKLEQTTDLTDPAAASSLVTALGFVNQAGFLPLQVSSSPELDNPEVSDGVSREAEVFFPRLLSDTSDCKD